VRGCQRTATETILVPFASYEKQGFTVCADAMNRRSGAQDELAAAVRQRIAA
jgi:hypothetical protein